MMQELMEILKLNSILNKLFNVVLNTDSGNYVVVWKKDGGQWKKVIDIFN